MGRLLKAQARVDTVELEEEIAVRKWAEAALGESENRLRTIIETESDCVKVVAKDGRLLEMNAAGLAMLEATTLEQAQQQSLLEFIVPEFRTAFQNLHQRIFKGENGALEFQVMGLKGARRWLETTATPLRDASGRIQALLGIMRDITEHKQAAEALWESEARTKMLVKSSNIGLWDWNLLTNEVFFSSEWKSQLGHGEDEISGRYEEWESRLHPEDREATLAAVDDYRQGRVADYDLEFRLRHKDGSWRWILARADLVRDASGQSVRMMGCHIDITERKEAEEALIAASEDITAFRAMQQQLEQANRDSKEANKAKDEFLAIVSHDLRSPLTAILLGVEMMAQKGSRMAAPMRKKLLDHIVAAVQQQARLANDLLGLARTESGKVKLERSEFLLSEAVGESVGTVSLSANAKGVSLVVDLASNEPTMFGDRSRLVQLFNNLLTNAVKFTGTGGRVTVRTRPEGEVMVATVSDTGIGIPGEELPHLFEKFKGHRKGTSGESGVGLGLAIVQQIVELHGGKIDVQSEPAAGATFTLRLPLRPEGLGERFH